MKIRCPECDAVMKVAEEDVEDGRRLRCPDCGVRFDPFEEEEEDDRPRRSSKRKKSGRNSGGKGGINTTLLVVGIGGGLLVLLLAIGVVLLIAFRPVRKQATPSQSFASQSVSPAPTSQVPTPPFPPTNRLPTPPPPSTAQVPPPSSPTWIPDPARVNQLAPEIKILGYGLRPLQGYQQQPFPGGKVPNGQMVIFSGPQHPEGTKPVLLLLVATLPPQEQQLSVEQSLDQFYQAFQTEYRNFTRTAPERGQVNGLMAVRSRWSGRSLRAGSQQGFGYMFRDGPKMVQILFQDSDKYYPTSMPMAEAAVLTMRKP